MQNLIVKNDPKSPVSEAYRTLRTNIQFANLDDNIKTILVTSSGPGEGKSTTATNLALTLAETGSKVIIIDCDLRKPNVHKQFGISNVKGLSNILAKGTLFEDACNKFMDNLTVVTSGTIPPNPAEMLASNKMKLFLQDLNDKYDYIIIDTPPVIAVTDAQILAAGADGVLLVVSSKQADRDAAIRAKTLLLKVNAKILGVLLNKVDKKSRSSYGYYYYYGKEGKEVNSKK